MPIPVYEPMLVNSHLDRRVLEILLNRISRRTYRRILPEMTETLAVSKVNIGHELIEANEQALKGLCERCFEAKRFWSCTSMASIRPTPCAVAPGADTQGYKHVLGLHEGSSEDATAVKNLLTDIVCRGLETKRRRLPAIDGSRVLRTAIDEVFTINRLELPGQLRRCLAGTNIIESPYAGIRRKTGRVIGIRKNPCALSSGPKLRVTRVISTGGRRPQWRNLAAHEPHAGFLARCLDSAALRST